MRHCALLCGLLLSAMVFAQEKAPAREEPAPQSWMPHPFIFLGPSLVGNGYQDLAAHFGSGFLLKSRQLVGDFEVSYMNAKKVNDGTVNNYSGHERFLQGGLFVPWKRGLYFGGGARWSETATTNYTKKAWRPTLGIGQDYFTQGFNTRWQVVYVTKGSDHSNALQGPEVQFWLPTPASKSHFVYRQTIGIYEFHTTITDPRDPLLTARRTSGRHSAVFVDFSLGWKF